MEAPSRTKEQSSDITRPVLVEPATRLYQIVMDHQHKPDGAGEDAPPIATCDAYANRGLIGVFDGMGGAGGETVESDDGPARTNAWLASRRAADIVLEVYEQLTGGMHAANSAPSSGDFHGQQMELPENQPPFDFTEELKRALQERLTRYAADIGVGGSGLLKSKLIRTLPTTMAICTFDLSSHEYTAIWAGDSRVYCLNPDPEVGLQQVTTDHLKTSPDAMQNLTRDAIMSNCVSASADFVLEERRLAMPARCVLIAATDGCFGYVHTPLQFEYMLLSSMQEAQSFPDWGERLKAAIIQVTSDDATLAAFAIGWRDFATCRKHFANRFQWCAKRVIALDAKRDLAERLEGDLGRAREELATLTQEQWEEYRRAYEFPTHAPSRVVPKPPDGGPSGKSRPAREGTGDDGEVS